MLTVWISTPRSAQAVLEGRLETRKICISLKQTQVPKGVFSYLCLFLFKVSKFVRVNS